MQCPYCSEYHPANAQFCPRTGKTLPVQQPPSSRRFYMRLGVVSTLLIAISLIMLLSNNGNSANPEEAQSSSDQTIVQSTDQPGSPTKKPTSTSLPRPTSTPLFTKTSTPQKYPLAQISCADNLFKVNLRRTPGFSNKSPSDSIYEIPCGEYVELLGDTQNADGLKWWNIKWNSYIGWVADHTVSGKTILIFND